MEEQTDYGYGDVDAVAKETSGAGKYLNFKKGDKGRIIQIRLVSEPRHVNQHWVSDVSGKQSPVNCGGDTCPYCGKSVPLAEKLKKVAKWGWIVIDREDEGVKVFTGPTLIALSIKDISELKNIKTKKVMWGNPLNYDLQIKRTEAPGAGYYEVNPVAEGMGAITEEEKAKVVAAGYDLVAELKGSEKSDNVGNYGGASELETAPADEIADIPDNLGAEEKGSEEVNPDDIPF